MIYVNFVFLHSFCPMFSCNLQEYGGIYLDSDMVVIKKLDMFRDVQMAAGKAGSSWNLANGVLISVANHSLMKVIQLVE